LSALHIFQLNPGVGFSATLGLTRTSVNPVSFPINNGLPNENGEITDAFIFTGSNLDIGLPPSFVIYSDPNDAAGASISTVGYPGVSVFGFDGNTAYIEEGFLVAPQGENVLTESGLFQTNDNFVVIPGMSGGAVWQEADFNNDGVIEQYILGVIRSIPPAVIVDDNFEYSGSFITPISEVYQNLAITLASLGADLNNFGTHSLIADQDGIGPDGQLNNFVQGTGFNEDIYIDSLMGITVTGGGGFDTVIYNPLDGGITFTQGPDIIFANRANGVTDSLSDIDFIIGSIFSDTFQINNFSGLSP